MTVHTIGGLLTEAVEWLQRADLSSSTAHLDAEVLMAHVLNQPRSYLYTWPEKCVTQEQRRAFWHYVEQRVEGQPIAYLTGSKEFWGLDLTVTPDVLIPRPDTELIVELALTRTLPDNAVVADLGTGSGAIALALASERPTWEVYGVDQSSAALQVASGNAALHRLHNVTFLAGHWCEPLSKIRPHMIVTNPPYIRQNDVHLQQGDVRFEPVTALASGENGLDDIRQIVVTAKQRLLIGGWLLIEHGFDQSEHVVHLLNTQGYQGISVEQDLTGHDRVTFARWSGLSSL